MIGTSRSVWGFDPRSVPGCQLWLDAADSNTVTGTTSVTAWTDKSGNGNNAVFTGTNPSYTPANKYVETSNLNQEFSIPGTIFNTVGGSLFIVYADKQQNTQNGMLYAISSGYTPHFFNQSLYRSDGYSYALGGVPEPGNTFKTTLNTKNTVLYSINYVHNSVNYTVTVNGTAFPFTSSGVVVPSGSLVFSGGWGGAANIKFNEILFFNSIITTTQRQQIEGYLAHKWGLTGYYDSSIPLSIPGCQLWLDAADSSTITLSTTKVTQWNDKSGNGYNFTQSTSGNQPTYSVASQNNQNTITFTSANSTYLLGTASTNFIGTNSLSVYGVFKTNDRNSGASVFAKSLAGGAAGRILYAVRDPGNPGNINSGIGTLGENAYANTLSDTYTAGAWRIHGFVSDRSGWTTTAYQNGTTIATTTIPSNTTTNLTNAFPMLVGAYNNGSGGANPPQPGYYLDGGVGELLVFSTALTTTQRQTIEGYLAKKWGIGPSSSIPSTHPFSSIRPHLRTFQPIDVPGCQLWLDGADQSSMTLSGSSVTQWNDKSGNGRNVIQTTTTPTDRRPTYSNGVLNFNGANFLSGTNTFSVVDSGTLFAVARHSSTRGRVIDIRNNTMSLGIEFGTTPDLFFHNSFGRWGQSFTDGTNDLQIIVNTRNGSSAPQYARNGGSLISFTSSQSSAANNGSYFAVGYDPTGAQYLNGVLCDIIYYSNALTTSQRQQVEGYLAHKWGLTPSLPVISPLSIPGCQLWLDAADSSSMTLSGSSVTQWRDKSLNVSSTTSVAGSNVLTQNAMNGRPAILLNGSSSFTGSTTGSGTTLTVCIVATQASECVSDGGLVCFGRSGFSDWNDVGSLAITKWASNSGQMVSTRVTNSQTVNTGLSTPFIYILVFDGTFVNSYLNGTIQTPSNISRTGTFAYTKYTIGTRADTGTASWTGFIGESIVYNTALTTSQRQQIEGYLARKWGISISATLPSPHPFKSFPPASLPFSPRNISGLALWLDGADQSSMTLSGSSVTQWRDKSGNGNNSTSSSATYTAGINGLGSMNNPTISGPITNSGSSTVTIFVIASNNRTGNSYDNMIALNVSPITNYYASGSLFLTRHGDLTNPQVFYAFMNGFPNGDLSFSFNTPFNTPFIFNIFQSGTVGSTYGNGTSYGDVNTRGATFNYTHYYIGTCTGGPAWIGNIGEVIIYNSALTTSQRQQVEGYLAQKWGLTGSLPSSHPFKKLPA